MSDAVGRLRQLGDNATEGRWENRYSGDVWKPYPPDSNVGNAWLLADLGRVHNSNRDADAEFIAAARNVWDALLDVAERASEVMAVTVEERTCCPQCEAAGKEPFLADDEQRLRAALDRLDKETPS